MSTTTLPLQERDTNQPEMTLKKSKLSVSFTDKENTLNGEEEKVEKPLLVEENDEPLIEVIEQVNVSEEEIFKMKELPWAKYLVDYNYQDFGGDYEEQDDEFFYDITNENVTAFDQIAVDEHDIMSISGEESDEFSEGEEAEEYAKYLNLPSTSYAIEKVGSNDLLVSWIEKHVSSLDDGSIANYERMTIEIEKVERKLKAGLENVLQFFLNTNSGLWISRDTIEFCKRLYLQYCSVVYETATMISSLRDEQILLQDDFVAALKHLGRPIYYEKMENDEEESLDKETFFDAEVMSILASFILGSSQEHHEIYSLLQRSFEDFFSIVVSNACKLQREYKDEEPLTVTDLKIVISLWQNSPYESSNTLIQKIIL